MIKRDTNFKEPTQQGMEHNACYQLPFVCAWWSAGITSAVACKIALELYDNVELYYIEIDTAHEDNARFKADCEKWYGCKIKTLKSKYFNNQFDVIKKTGAVNTPTGAPCTLHLKKNVRFEFEKWNEWSLFNEHTIKNQVWGYEFEAKEINRAIRHLQQYPSTKPLFPLIEKGLTKEMCAGLLLQNGIELPKMYELGYSNNNCIGCVKGGKGYWNKIRKDFPTVFKQMAHLEREVGYSCINGLFLDELTIKMGRMKKEIMPNCGNICEVDFADLPDKNLEAILTGKMNIYDTAS
jgi:hypothetical protein